MITELERLKNKWKETWKDKTKPGWKNEAKGWYIHDAKPGLYTLDIEHVPTILAKNHNDINHKDNIAKRYRIDLCPHKCSFCFNEENAVYRNKKLNPKTKLVKQNKIMGINETFSIIDQAIKIAKKEGHEFKSVKFLGPGELLINPELFEILDEYKKRNIHIGIFTKGAILGDDNLAKKHFKLTSKELVNKIAEYKNASLLFSFQSFDPNLQNNIVTTTEANGEIKGIKNYSSIREKALDHLFKSKFYSDGYTNRVCIINAPIIPENIDESFDIYKFFTKRGTPVVMTPSMISGKGCGQIEKQKIQLNIKEWHSKLIELYAKIYDYNVKTNIQTIQEIKKEGIASYAGAAPCNQTSTGMYIRANGYIQMCPGRFDNETFFGDLENNSLEEIWNNSPNKQRGIHNPQCLINNKCPAKDGLAFPNDFYEKVMKRFLELQKYNS